MLDQIRALIIKAQQYSKAIVASVGTLLTAVTALSSDLGVTIIPAEVTPYVTFALFVLTSFATWAVPNVAPYDAYTEGLGTLPREAGE